MNPSAITKILCGKKWGKKNGVKIGKVRKPENREEAARKMEWAVNEEHV